MQEASDGEPLGKSRAADDFSAFADEDDDLLG